MEPLNLFVIYSTRIRQSDIQMRVIFKGLLHDKALHDIKS